MERVAVVGLVAMGSRITLRLLDAGHDVVVWNRSPQRLEPLLACGASAAASPREAARRSRTLITMLADPEALRSVVAGPDGVAAGMHSKLIVVEMSTVGPAAVDVLASLLEPTTRVVDAPVLGSISEIETGTLTIFAGGSTDLVDQVRPLLSCLGTVVHVGPRGTGAAARLVANAALLGTLAILGETLALADTLELPPDVTAQVLEQTTLAEQARRRLPLIEKGDYRRRFGLSTKMPISSSNRPRAPGCRYRPWRRCGSGSSPRNGRDMVISTTPHCWRQSWRAPRFVAPVRRQSARLTTA